MKLFLSYLKSFGLICGTIVTLYAVFKMYDNIIDGQEKTMEVVEYINVEQGMMAEDITSIKDTLERMEGKIDDNSISIYSTNSLMKYERNHRDEYTKEQMEDQLKQFEELLKKKQWDERLLVDTIPILKSHSAEIIFIPIEDDK